MRLINNFIITEINHYMDLQPHAEKISTDKRRKEVVYANSVESLNGHTNLLNFQCLLAFRVEYLINVLNSNAPLFYLQQPLLFL